MVKWDKPKYRPPSRAVAQLVERVHGVHEAASSSLVGPTSWFHIN